MKFFKALVALVKPYIRWVILTATLVFLGHALAQHWQEAIAIPIRPRGWGIVAIATAVTLFSHIWSGWVWTLILQEFDCTVPKLWTVQVYLKTNIAKYLPGNVWHFYGRVRAMHAAKVPWAIAVLSVVIEPLLDIAAALLVAIGLGGLERPLLQLVGLAIVLLALHPAALNPGIHYLSKLKLKPASAEESSLEKAIVARYPLIPLLGEVIFFILRSLGFLLIVVALTPDPLQWQQFPLLMSSFSVAYFLGLVVPGAPGGIGVFEATLVALLELHFSAGLLLKSVAIYRLVSIVAEVTGAGLASIQLPDPLNKGLR
ncbi:lysylphosphatidylglycerol synthase domain-containing protein [Synechococcus sp. PCC 7336]|uniref:lysylphosphatidylglycerol synthase domain-containing protein n=1 Tax=Synechococcus sp. PCC 7336 TaxID=195250 RepID=UPI000349538A|nr:lysylphosphatidylglycerol synthase domain-containing protein [Synechococcus sp. PCC 7336]